MATNMRSFVLIACLLLLLQAYNVFTLSCRMSCTYNEQGHITAGLSCWHLREFGFYSVNPPFPKMISTAGLFCDKNVDLTALRYIHPASGVRDELDIGFVFADTNSQSFHKIVQRARMAGVVWVVIGGLTIWRWSASCFGEYGGLLSLSLWAFEPTVTAHAALATGDVPSTVVGVMASYSFSMVMDSPTFWRLSIAGVLLGVSLLCKFTLLLLLPAWFMAWTASVYFKDARRMLSYSLLQQTCAAAYIMTLCWFVLIAGYDFKVDFSFNGDRPFVSKLFSQSVFIQNSVVKFLSCLIPADYVCGIDIQQRDFEGRLDSYLNGEWCNHGWWYYYILAFLVKTPIGSLCLYVYSAIAAFSGRVRIPALLWIIPVVIVFAASIKTGYTNSLRYVLPAYPYLLVGAGCLIPYPTSPAFTFRQCLSIFFVAITAFSVLSSIPFTLGYFNEFVGGGREGWRYLAEGNVDWGQDMIALRDWLESHPTSQRLHVSLVSIIDPSIYLLQDFPVPHRSMAGYAIVDAQSLTKHYPWLLDHPIVDRVGFSIFVFEVSK